MESSKQELLELNKKKLFWKELEQLGWLESHDIRKKYDGNPVLQFLMLSDNHLAASTAFRLLQTAVELGADVNHVSDSTGKTPLMAITRTSIDENHDSYMIEVTQWLLSQGADVNTLDSDREHVAFWLAMPQVTPGLCETLLPLYLEAGLDWTQINAQGETLEFRMTWLGMKEGLDILHGWEVKQEKDKLDGVLPNPFKSSLLKRI